MNQKNSLQIEEVLQEKDSEKQKEKYNEYVSNITPKSNRFLNCAKAFLVGGTICLPVNHQGQALCLKHP